MLDESGPGLVGGKGAEVQGEGEGGHMDGSALERVLLQFVLADWRRMVVMVAVRGPVVRHRGGKGRSARDKTSKKRVFGTQISAFANFIGLSFIRKRQMPAKFA